MGGANVASGINNAENAVSLINGAVDVVDMVMDVGQELVERGEDRREDRRERRENGERGGRARREDRRERRNERSRSRDREDGGPNYYPDPDGPPVPLLGNGDPFSNLPADNIFAPINPPNMNNQGIPVGGLVADTVMTDASHKGCGCGCGSSRKQYSCEEKKQYNATMVNKCAGCSKWLRTNWVDKCGNTGRRQTRYYKKPYYKKKTYSRKKSTKKCR